MNTYEEGPDQYRNESVPTEVHERTCRRDYPLARPVESGEAMLDGDDLNARATEPSFPTLYQAAIVARTVSVYSTAAKVGYMGDTANRTQRYLRNRLSYSVSFNYNDNPLDDSVASFFSYDPHGNVEWTMKVIPGLGANYVGYSYDLYSGSMRRVDYNDGWTDQYHQRYSYDEDNRIRLVESSRDGRIWDRDARYHYYLHGPLRRVELGEDSVQALDYVYTIEGWLKGINHPTLDTAQDPGNDGKVGSHRNVARDLFGMILGYYAGDYERACRQRLWFNAGRRAAPTIHETTPHGSHAITASGSGDELAPDRIGKDDKQNSVCDVSISPVPSLCLWR